MMFHPATEDIIGNIGQFVEYWALDKSLSAGGE